MGEGLGFLRPEFDSGRRGLFVLTTFRRVRFMTMLGISGVALPDRRPHPVSSLRLGEPPHDSPRAALHPADHRQSRAQLPNVATRVQRSASDGLNANAWG